MQVARASRLIPSLVKVSTCCASPSMPKSSSSVEGSLPGPSTLCWCCVRGWMAAGTSEEVSEAATPAGKAAGPPPSTFW